MIRHKYIFAVAMAMAITTSCRDESWIHDVEGDEYGTLSTEKMNYQMNGEQTVIGRASSTVDVSDFIVDIQNGTKVEETYKHKNLPSSLSLKTGDNYNVHVRSSENAPKAAWETPYYEGSSNNFEIRANMVTEVQTVVCRLANIKVTIRVSEALRNLMAEDCVVKVIANDSGVLDFTLKEIDEGTAGFFEFIDKSNTLVATLTGTIDGENITQSIICTDLAQGQHRIFNFTIKTADGEISDPIGSIDASNGVAVDANVTTIDLNMKYAGEKDELISGILRPGYDDTTDSNDPGTDPTPENPDIVDPVIVIKSETLSFEAPNSPDITSAIVDIESKNGIANFKVKITSDNDQFIASAGELLPLDFDLAYPPEESVEGFASLGFPLKDEVIGATELTFNITDLVPLLKAFNGTHEFRLEVIDSKGNKEIKTLTIVSE